MTEKETGVRERERENGWLRERERMIEQRHCTIVVSLDRERNWLTHRKGGRKRGDDREGVTERG